MKTQREFELTEFEAPTKIRWAERSKIAVTASEGGYDLEPAGDGQTRLTIHNVLEPATLRASSSSASRCARRARAPTTSRARSRRAVESEVPPPSG